jgi:nucleoside-diphosphate-sugar epimerase
MRVLVTGASGFVGRSLCLRLLQNGWKTRGTLLANELPTALTAGISPIVIDPFGPTTSCENALKDIDVVIHLASRVHVMHDTSLNPLKEFRWTNTAGTIRLANQAAAVGAKRFVFMSTIGVNGNASGRRAFTENDEPNPNNPYSISKLEAEIELKEISERTGIEVVIVRAPLVYGPGNPGNFLSLLRIISKGIPLPLASVHNQKSFLYVNNLADALACCATHPIAAGKTYLVSDGEDISTPDLIRRSASALGVPVLLLPFPPSLMLLAGKLTGKGAAVNRLMGSLTVDSSKIRRELGWRPPFTMDEGLRKTALWFKDVYGKKRENFWSRLR